MEPEHRRKFVRLPLARTAALWLAINAASSALAVHRPALAQPPPSKAELQAARDLFAQGTSHEEARQWAAALEKFTRAGTIKLTPGIRFHIAYCEEQLGRLVEALADYSAALEQSREQNNREASQSSSDALAELRPRVPSLRIIVPDARDVDVQVDEKPVPPSGAGYLALLNPGTHKVVVRAAGARPYRATQVLTERQSATLEVQFEYAAPPPPLVAAPAPVTPPPAPPPKARRTFWTPGHSIAIAVLGASALAAGGGAYFAFKGLSSRDDADQLRTQLGNPTASCAQPTNAGVASTCDSLHESLEAHQTQYNWHRGLYFTAAGLAVTSVAIFFLWPEPKSKEKVAKIQFAPTLDIGARSVGLQGTF